MTGFGDKQLTWLLAAALAAATVITFWQVTGCDFVNYDDPDYVTENQQVQAGLTSATVRWAFTTGHAGNWHPLTWLSHALDVQLFGLNPRGHHLNNLLLHAANAVLVLLLFRRLTGAVWRSALLAALFALHPLRVESVAWVAERKDVLSAFFGLLTLIAYARYAQTTRSPASSPQDRNLTSGEPPSATNRPNQGAASAGRAALWYGTALVFFALGLMSKPMLVTWPCVMLLLDAWPLQRLPGFEFRIPSGKELSSFCRRHAGLLWEKLPFMALTVASSIITFSVQKAGGAMTVPTPLGDRLANALVAYGRYLGKLFWPAELAVFYPFPEAWPAEIVLLGGLILLVMTGAVLREGGRHGWLFTGWFWFLGTLVPVIGLVKVGGQSMADRYSYLPSLGVLLLVVWGGHALATRRSRLKRGLQVAAWLVVAALAFQSHRQIRHWANGETLFAHALTVTERNEVAHNNLGVMLLKAERWEEARQHFAAAVAIKSRYVEAHMNLGSALHRLGRDEEALAHLRRAVELQPDSKAHYNLGTTLLALQQFAAAREHLLRAAQLRPDFAEAYLNQALAELALGQPDVAVATLETALRLQPRWFDAHFNLGNARAAQRRYAEAAGQFSLALALRPDDGAAHFNLANALLPLGRRDEAITHLQRVVELNPDDQEARRQLAALTAAPVPLTQIIQQLRAALARQPDPAVELQLAQALTAAGQPAEAITHYRAVLQTQPDWPEALNNLAWLLATAADPALRRGEEAVTLAERACELTQREQPVLLGTLAAAYAAAGRFDAAVRTAEEAIKRAEAAGLTEIAQRNAELLKRYRAGLGATESEPQ